MGEMLTVLTLLKVKPSPNGEQHGERPFWREFGEQYLAAWLRSTDRFIPHPHRVVVMTDSKTYLRYGTSDVAEREVDYIALDKTVDAPGFWAKLEMFKHGQGKCLYLDLDNVITGPLDQLCDLTPDPLIMLDDKRVPRLPNGSTILFDAERCRGIWDAYVADRRSIEATFVANGEDYSRAYDQAFIDVYGQANGWHAPFFQDLLPTDYCLNAVSELPHAEDWRDSRLIFGGGANGKPHRMNHPAIAEHWHA